MTHHDARGTAALAVLVSIVFIGLLLPWWITVPIAIVVTACDDVLLHRTTVSLCSECKACKGWVHDA